MIIIGKEKIDKYLDLARKLKKVRNMKVTVIPIVVGSLGTVLISIEKRLEELEIRGRNHTNHRLARILRRVLETWRDLLSLRSSERTLAKAGGVEKLVGKACEVETSQAFPTSFFLFSRRESSSSSLQHHRWFLTLLWFGWSRYFFWSPVHPVYFRSQWGVFQGLQLQLASLSLSYSTLFFISLISSRYLFIFFYLFNS